MKLKLSISATLLLVVNMLWGQCLTPKPTIDTAYIKVCQSWWDCSKTLFANSNDTINWYRVNGLDTLKIGTGSHISPNETGTAGIYHYLISSQNVCESDFVPLTVEIMPYTKIKIDDTSIKLNFYDSIYSIKATPAGGKFYFDGHPEDEIYDYMMSCEKTGQPSKGLDSMYILHQSQLKLNYNYTLNYTYYNENGCGNSAVAYFKLPKVPEPTGKSEYMFRDIDTNMVLTVDGDSNAIFTWYKGISVSNGNELIGTGKKIKIDNKLFNHFMPSTYGLSVTQTINNYTSASKNIVVKIVKCYASKPNPIKLIENVVENSTMPILQGGFSNLNCEMRWYDFNTYNNNAPILGVGNSFIPSKCGEYYVVNVDTFYNCKSEPQKIVVKSICNTQVKPIVDSLIADTIYSDNKTKLIKVANVLNKNQTCKWYVNDSINSFFVGNEFNYNSISKPNTFYVSIYDTVAQCESNLQRITYKPIDCWVDFTFPKIPFNLYLGDTMPVLTAKAPGQKIYWYNGKDSLLAIGNTYIPKIAKAGFYSYNITVDSGKCKYKNNVLFYVNSNTIYGSVYFTYGISDLSTKGQIVKIMPNDEYVTIDKYGKFTFNTSNYGNYKVSFVNSKLFESESNSSEFNVSFNTNNHNDSVTFFVKPKVTNDITLSLTNTMPPAVGRIFPIVITVQNFGATQYNVPVEFNYSKEFNYSFKNSNTSLFKMDTTVTFTIDSIASLHSIKTIIYLEVQPDFTLTNKEVNLFARISTVLKNDENTANNQESIKAKILNSYDPNDKKVSPCYKNEGFVTFGTPLTYTIRFQNKGTIDAENIKIVDTLNANLDLATFEVIDASDTMNFDISGRVVTFHFDNIHLLDSATNEPASHGFVKYRITPKPIIDENTIVTNTAHIYFDYNPAVVTNTALSTFVSKLPAEKSEQTSVDVETGLKVYPTLVHSSLFVALDETISTIEIFNSVGQNVISLQDKSGLTQINCADLLSGVYIYKIISQGNITEGRFVKQ